MGICEGKLTMSKSIIKTSSIANENNSVSVKQYTKIEIRFLYRIRIYENVIKHPRRMTNSASGSFYFVIYANGTHVIIVSGIIAILTAYFIYILNISTFLIYLYCALKLLSCAVFYMVFLAFYATSNQIPPLFSR